MKSSATAPTTPPQGQNLREWPFNENDSNPHPPYHRPFSSLLASAQRRARDALSRVRPRSAGGNGVRTPSPSDGHHRFQELRRQLGTPIVSAVQRLMTPSTAVQRVWDRFHGRPTQEQLGLGDDHPPSDLHKQYKLIASTKNVINPVFHDQGTICIVSPSILSSILHVQEPSIKDDVDTRIAQVFTHKSDMPTPPPPKKIALQHLLSNDLFRKLLGASTGRRDNGNVKYYTISVRHPRSKIKHKKKKDEIQQQISNSARLNHIILYLYKNDLVALLEEEGDRRSFLVPSSQYSARVFYLPVTVVTRAVEELKQNEVDEEAALMAEAAEVIKLEDDLVEVLRDRESIMVKAGNISATEVVFDTKYIKIFVGRAYEFNDEAIKMIFQTYGNVVLSGRNDGSLFIVMYFEEGADAISGLNTEEPMDIIVRKARDQSIPSSLLVELEEVSASKDTPNIISKQDDDTPSPSLNTQATTTAVASPDDVTPSRSLKTPPVITAAAASADVKQDDDDTPPSHALKTPPENIPSDAPPPRLEEESPILTHAQQHVVNHYGNTFFDSTGRCIYFKDKEDNDLINKCLDYAIKFGMERKTKPQQPNRHGLTHQQVLEAKLRIIKALSQCDAPERDPADKNYLCAATMMLEPGDYTNVLLMHCRVQYKRGGHSLEREGFCNEGHVLGNCCTSRCVSVVDSAMHSSIVTGKVLKHNLCFNGNSKCTTSDDEKLFKRCGRTSKVSGGSLALLLNTFISGMEDMFVNIFAHCMSGMSCKVPKYVMDKLTRTSNLVVCDEKNFHAQFFETRCLGWTVLQQKNNMTGYILAMSELYSSIRVEFGHPNGKSIYEVAIDSDVLVFVTNNLDSLMTLFAKENRGYGHIVEFLVANVKKHGELSVLHQSVPSFITRYANSCLDEFIQSDIGEVTLRMLHNLLCSRRGAASAASQLAALGPEAYSKRMSDKGRAGGKASAASQKKALGPEAYDNSMSVKGRAGGLQKATTFRNLDLETSIEEAIRHKNSVKKAVKTICSMDEIVMLRRSISSLSFGGSKGNTSDMILEMKAWYRQNRQHLERKRKDEQSVKFKLHDFPDVPVDEVKNSFRSIIHVWKNNPMFLGLEQWEIKAAFLKVFGFVDLELSIREAIKNKTSVDEVVKTIRSMDDIVELRRSISSLSFGGANPTFTLGIRYWRDRPGGCTNPARKQLSVSPDLKSGSKSVNLQNAMKVVLIIWQDDSRINGMDWDDIKELLYKTFKPKR
ncbi:hypothetical protein ACHAWC_008430 [Mediolabrus comicus]